MKSSTLLAFAAIGAAAALLLTTKRGKALTQDLLDNADEIAGNLNKFSGKAGGQITDLKKLVSKEVSGLGEDARRRIQNILSEGAGRAKSAASSI